MPISQPHERPKIERYVLEGFTGGLHSEAHLSKVAIQDNECTCASNVEFWPIGTISKRNGISYKNESDQLSGAVTMVYQWWAESGANYMLCFQAASATCSAQVLLMTTATQTSASFAYILSSGEQAGNWNPDEDDAICVETFGGSALFVDGTDKLFAYDGVSCSSIDAAPDGAVAIRGYKNYLFLANAEDDSGTRQNSRIWWSDPGDAHTWPSANYLDIDAKDGDLITGMEVLGNELIVFKERKIFAVTYVGGIYDFYAENRMNGIGCASRNSIIPIFSELVFYGIENIYSFTGRDVESLGDKIKDIITYQILAEHRSKICGITYEEKNQLWWSVPLDETLSGNSHLLVMDYDTDAWSIYTGRAASLGWYNLTTDLYMKDLGGTYASYDSSWGDRLFLSNAALIMAGTYNGYIVDRGTAGTTSDLDDNYTGFWRSKWIDFGFPDINKRITRITVYIDKEVESEDDDYDLYLKVYTDYDRETVVKQEAISVYGNYPVLERRVDFTASCRTLQIEIGSTAKAQPFTIHRIVIDWIPKGRTLVT